MVVDDALVLNPIIVYPFLVIVGASTVHEVDCDAPLYVVAIVHDFAAVLESVAPFAFQFAVNVAPALLFV